PLDKIVAEADSLMAGKKCFFEAFDIVFANLNDRRLDGIKMKDFARHCNPCAKYYICGEQGELYEWNVIDEHGYICEDGVDGAVTYPVTKEKIISALRSITVTSSKCGIELDDDMLELAAAGCDSDAVKPFDNAAPDTVTLNY
ncbi:MAG: hypothetical protein ACI4Q6_05465, partial [Huintestinicola sp.]